MTDRLNDSKSLVKKAIDTISSIKNEAEKSVQLQSSTSEKSKKTYKDAKSGKIDIDEFRKAVYTIIEADDYLYKKAPLHELNDEEAKSFCKLIMDAQKHLNNVLKEFGFEFEEEINIDKNALYIVGNKKLMENLKDIDPNLNVIFTEGVLTPEDMKEINPKIPEKALAGIKKKCEIINKQISKTISNIKPSRVIVVVEEGSRADELIYLRAKEYYNAEKVNSEDIFN